MKSFALNALMTLSLLILPWTATYAAQCQGHHEMLKDVKKEVEKIENGVIIKITSDNPEAVKRIQERAAEDKDMACKQGKRKHRRGEKDHHS